MLKTGKIINKEVWRDIYRLELTIGRLEKLIEPDDGYSMEEEEDEFVGFQKNIKQEDQNGRELREYKRILWQLKKENPTEPAGKELLEILESVKN